MIFKFLISAVLLGSSIGNDGWYPVEKGGQVPDQAEDRDLSIWVLFVKSLEKERFLIRFPDEPAYRYLEGGELELISEREGEIFQLTVRPLSPHSLVDLTYPSEGKWAREHFFQTERYLYHFKTLSKSSDSKNMQAFISSFSIEENR